MDSFFVWRTGLAITVPGRQPECSCRLRGRERQKKLLFCVRLALYHRNIGIIGQAVGVLHKNIVPVDVVATIVNCDCVHFFRI